MPTDTVKSLAIPVVELLRVSTADQAEDDRAGLARQEEANRRTVARKNLSVIRTIRLVDVSGTATMYAPEIQAMLDLVRTGQARGIVVADFDRLLRPDDFRTLAILQDIKEAGALIYLPDQTLDLRTQAGFLMSGLSSIIAGNELAQIKRRMQGAKEEKRRQGKCPQSHICLPLGVGYDRKDERYYYTEDAARVRELFDLFHGQGVANLCEIGRRVGMGNVTVRNLLRNELFIGYRTYNQKRSQEARLKPDGRRADRRKVARAEHERIRVKVIDEPLIQESVFWAVQEALTDKRAMHRGYSQATAGLFLYRHLLRCGLCGEPMYTVPGGHRGGPIKDYYYCRTHNHAYKGRPGCPCGSGYQRRQEVEDAVGAFIAEHLGAAGYILAQLERAAEDSRDTDNGRELTEIKAALGRQEKKRKRALALHLDGILEREDLDAALAAVAQEVDRLNAKAGGLARRRMVTQQQLAEVAARAAEAFAAFPYWSKDEKRAFLEQERPVFWILEGKVVKFSLPSFGGKNSSHMGRG